MIVIIVLDHVDYCKYSIRVDKNNEDSNNSIKKISFVGRVGKKLTTSYCRRDTCDIEHIPSKRMKIWRELRL